MPTKPALIYDGDCDFCRVWLGYAQALLGDDVEWIPSREIGDRFAEIARAEFTRAVVFASSSGEVSRGAEAIWKLLALSQHHRWALWLYRRFPPFAALSDAIYGYVAKHRDRALVLARLTFGSEIRPLSYRLPEPFRSGSASSFLLPSHRCGSKF